jgi:polyisoprenoid-binding protein YceI
MSLTIRTAVRSGTAIACVLFLTGSLAANNNASGALRVTTGEVSVNCPLTIGGSFDAKTNAVTGEVTVGSGPQEALKGDLLVDLRKLQTGIGLRDRHLRENYLEVKKGDEFAAARLEDIRVEALQGKTSFKAMLTLHGQKREVTGTANIKQNGDGYQVDADFPVRYADFGIAEATYLGVGVKEQVHVRANFVVAPSAAPSAASR